MSRTTARYPSHQFDAARITSYALLFGGAVALGAGLMFLLDPQGGGWRRALIRDKASRYARETGTTLRKQAQQVSNKARGLAAEARSAIKGVGGSETVDDEKLCQRIRAAIGRV